MPINHFSFSFHEQNALHPTTLNWTPTIWASCIFFPSIFSYCLPSVLMQPRYLTVFKLSLLVLEPHERNTGWRTKMYINRQKYRLSVHSSHFFSLLFYFSIFFSVFVFVLPFHLWPPDSSLSCSSHYTAYMRRQRRRNCISNCCCDCSSTSSSNDVS